MTNLQNKIIGDFWSEYRKTARFAVPEDEFRLHIEDTLCRVVAKNDFRTEFVKQADRAQSAFSQIMDVYLNVMKGMGVFILVVGSVIGILSGFLIGINYLVGYWGG